MRESIAATAPGVGLVKIAAADRTLASLVDSGRQPGPALHLADLAQAGFRFVGFHELRSPIVGTFYSGPSPGAPRFVAVGARVSKGQTLCIVEAMKVMNEIESEIDAEVMEVLVADGQPVEFGEVLFRLRPAG